MLALRSPRVVAWAARAYSATPVRLWGSGGWGGEEDGWGKAAAAPAAASGGWGAAPAAAPTPRQTKGAWGAGDDEGWGAADASRRGSSRAPPPRGGGGGFSRGGRGGWGGGGGAPAQSSGWGASAPATGGGGWGAADASFSDAPRGRGGFRGRGGGVSRGRGGWGAGNGGNAAGDDWGAIEPNYEEPFKKVDPLTLTAAPVVIDEIKKLVGLRVLVSGLSDETTWHSLKDHMRQAGECTFCKVFSGGRGVVEFTTPEEAAKAITELQGSELEGGTVYLREDREDVVLINTKRKIREAREALQRAKKDEEQKRLAAQQQPPAAAPVAAASEAAAAQ